MKYEIVDKSKLNYIVPKADGDRVELVCPKCGSKRVLIAFNVRPVGSHCQCIGYDYSVCQSDVCRCSEHGMGFPLNMDVEKLLRAADERDNIPAAQTEEKLKLLRKHYKTLKPDAESQITNMVDWKKASDDYHLKIGQSCKYNKEMERFFKPYKWSESSLGRYLRRYFTVEAIDYVADIYKQYLFDASDGQTQFYYYDYNGHLRNIKSIMYAENGHRVHTEAGVRQGAYFQNIIEQQLSIGFRFAFRDMGCTWKNNADYPTQQYLAEHAPQFRYKPELFLFGEHLLKSHQDADVYVVESEKTAMILQMYCYLNSINAICLATGSLTYFSPSLLAPLKGRKVIFWPDYDEHRFYWKDKVANFGNEYFESVEVYEWWDELSANDKDDIADVVLRKLAEQRKIFNN